MGPNSPCAARCRQRNENGWVCLGVCLNTAIPGYNMCRWHSFSCNHPGRQGIPDSWGVTSSPWQNTAHSWDGMLPDLQGCSKTGSPTPPTIYVAGLAGSSAHYSPINALRHSLAVGCGARTNKDKARRAGTSSSWAEESGFSLNNFQILRCSF